MSTAHNLPAELILGSSSVYRQELLQRLNLPFRCLSPDIDETPQAGESIAALSERLAREKGAKIHSLEPGACIISSDQAAELDGQAIGKPGSLDKAAAQLRAASGRELRFYTAVCLHYKDQIQSHVDCTAVQFRSLSNAEIKRYLDQEQPLYCAGSFKAEGLGISLFDRLESEDPTALIGLPLIAVSRMLRNWGWPI